MTTLSRRTFTLGSILSCLGAAASEKPLPSVKQRGSTRPNLVVMVADDLRWDCLGFMGNSIVQTPHLDSLAAAALTFDNAYVTTSICAPSRASIFSGQYVCRHGINDFSTAFTEEQWAACYPAQLRAAGYTTAFVGKFGVGDQLPVEAFDYWRGFGGQGQYEQSDDQGNYQHLTSQIRGHALAFLETVDHQKPFCLSVSFKSPHCQDGDDRQFIYDPVYESLYEGALIPQPEHLQDHFEDRFPDFFKKDSEARRRWEIRFSTPELYQKMVKGYYRLIKGIDDTVGAVRRELEKRGLAENTVILFCSDNGFFLGDHGLAGKWFGYEGSVRIPMLLFDPRISPAQQGRRSSQIALNIDIAPTLLQLAGVDVPASMQGSDLSPLFLSDADPWREDFFYEHHFKHPGIPRSEGLVSREYKYLHYIDEQPVYEELFDLRNDPHEQHNLVHDPQKTELLKEMRARYEVLKAACCP
ncbi:MAG: sulfatase [Candidatus Hydrogenedentes bacterium]|jgi:arylsulfatase A-like enzyme|nr:sulfatase [Candidatus Hydrogenedentota bacterium]